MAFPSSTKSLAEVWAGSQSTSGRIRIQAQEIRNTSTAGLRTQLDALIATIA